MTLDTITLPLIWALNGFLLIAYILLEYWTVVLLIAPLTWLTVTTGKSRRPWMLFSCGAALLTAIFAPPVIGVWLLLMAAGSVAALKLERFNPDLLRWRVAGGLAAYALVGLGFLAYRSLAPVLADPSGFFAQGQGYLDVIIGIAVYIFPLGFLGMLVQAIWVHPPIEGASPEDIIYRAQTRGHR